MSGPSCIQPGASPASDGIRPPHLRAWRVVQSVVLAGAGVLWLSLWFAPDAGLTILWNVIIPVAPALFVVAAGLWRNICPLATLSMVPRRAGISQRRRVSPAVQAWLQLVGVLLLLLIVPLRRVSLDFSGPATAVTLAAIGMMALGAGMIGEWKSAWCAGLCPVLPVEALYGSKTGHKFTNAHCTNCMACVSRCPDSLSNGSASASTRPAGRLAMLLMTGGFPGFIAGWMHVPDYPPGQGWTHAAEAWGWPALGMAGSLVLYIMLRKLLPARRHTLLATLFAAASVTVYYWYRLPGLLGFAGPAGRAGVLVDLHTAIPDWTPAVLRTAAAAFFLAWFLRPAPARSWMQRPPAARRPPAGRIEVATEIAPGDID